MVYINTLCKPMSLPFYADKLNLEQFKKHIKERAEIYTKDYKIGNYPDAIPPGYIEDYYKGFMIASLKNSEFGPQRINLVRETFPNHQITWVRSKTYPCGEEDPAMIFIHNKRVNAWNRFWWSSRWTCLFDENLPENKDIKQ